MRRKNVQSQSNADCGMWKGGVASVRFRPVSIAFQDFGVRAAKCRRPGIKCRGRRPRSLWKKLFAFLPCLSGIVRIFQTFYFLEEANPVWIIALGHRDACQDGVRTAGIGMPGQDGKQRPSFGGYLRLIWKYFYILQTTCFRNQMSPSRHGSTGCTKMQGRVPALQGQCPVQPGDSLGVDCFGHKKPGMAILGHFPDWEAREL